MKIARVMILLAPLALSACLHKPGKALPSAAPGVLAGLSAAASASDLAARATASASALAEGKAAQRDSRIKASAGTARDANAANPEGAPKVVVDGELGNIQSELADVASRPEDVAAAKARAAEAARLVEAGRADEARRNYVGSQATAAKLADDLSKARAATSTAKEAEAQARAAEAKARGDAATEIERNRAENQRSLDARDKEIADLKDGIARKTQLWLTMGCYGLGVLCVLGAALRGYMSFQTGGIGLAGAAKSVGLLIMFAAIFFGLGRLVSQAWFWYACGSALFLTVAAVAWILIDDARKAKALGQAHGRAAQVGDDLISAVHDVREKLRNLPADAIQALGADTPEKAAQVAKVLLDTVVDPTLKDYVTESDGTGAYVDARRRALSLVQ